VTVGNLRAWNAPQFILAIIFPSRHCTIRHYYCQTRKENWKKSTDLIFLFDILSLVQRRRRRHHRAVRQARIGRRTGASWCCCCQEILFLEFSIKLLIFDSLICNLGRVFVVCPLEIQVQQIKWGQCYKHFWTPSLGVYTKKNPKKLGNFKIKCYKKFSSLDSYFLEI